MESISKIKEILNNAPEGATHVSTNGVFYKIDGYTPLTWWVRGEEWIDSGVHHITQCLSDLRNQLALIEENEKLKAFIESISNIEHKRGGSLGVDGQFYYKVPESIFEKAKELYND